MRLESRFVKISLFILIALGLLFSPVAFAFEGSYKGKCHQEKGEQHSEKMKHFTEKLGLSEEQQEKLKAQHEHHRAAFKTLLEEVKNEQKVLHEELDKAEPNKSVLKKTMSKITKLKGQMLELHVDKVLATKGILTPEQNNKLKEMRQERKMECKDWRCRMKEWWQKGRRK